MTVTQGTDVVGVKLKKAAQNRLKSTGYSQLQAIRIDVTENRICLKGRVSRFYLKQLAQHAVMDLITDARVENELVVSGK